MPTFNVSRLNCLFIQQRNNFNLYIKLKMNKNESLYNLKFFICFFKPNTTFCWKMRRIVLNMIIRVMQVGTGTRRSCSFPCFSMIICSIIIWEEICSCVVYEQAIIVRYLLLLGLLLLVVCTGGLY